MISKNLDYIMSGLNMTNKELSELTGISEVSISRYRNGKRTPTLANLVKIAVALGVETDVLIHE